MAAISKQGAKGHLNVSGQGEIQATPDLASVQLGVVTQDKTAAQATADDAAKMAAVVKSLLDLGVPATDLQTSGFAVVAMTDAEPTSPTYGSITGYQVTSTLAAKLDPAQVGPALDAATTAGANAIGQLSFSLRDDSSERAAAMKAAIQSAMSDAAQAAKTLGVTLGSPESVDVSSIRLPMFAAGMMAAPAASKTPVESGQVTISAQANVVYAIRARR